MVNLQKNISLANFSTFRIGGNTDYFVRAKTKQDIQEAITFAKEKKITMFPLGGGSNILFSDKGYRGLVIKIENNSISFTKNTATVGAGAMNIEVYREAKKLNLDFSPFYTIPGSIGGAVMGNAGVPAGEIKDFFVSAEAFDTEKNEFIFLAKEFFDFSYRHTIFHEYPTLRKRYILFSVTLQFPQENKGEIEKKAKDFLTMRKEKQPWGKTGGSFFHNDTAGTAGYFLEQSGLKGFHVGGAFFSEKHANFMMNDGTATQKNSIELAQKAKKTVQEKFGVELHPEVRIIDEWGEEIHI